MTYRPFAKLTRALANPGTPGVWDDLGITGTMRPVSPWAQLTPPPPELLCPSFPPDDSETTAHELAAATCNARDFYPQEPGAWERARAERTEMFRLLEQVSDYAEQWKAHAAEHGRT